MSRFQVDLIDARARASAMQSCSNMQQHASGYGCSLAAQLGGSGDVSGQG